MGFSGLRGNTRHLYDTVVYHIHSTCIHFNVFLDAQAARQCPQLMQNTANGVENCFANPCATGSVKCASGQTCCTDITANCIGFCV